MKFDLSQLGWPALMICFGIAAIHRSDSNNRRTEACEQRGGHMVVLREHWTGDAYTCSLNLPPKK